MEILSYPFVQNALAGILLVSIVSAIIGTYIVTRRMTFIAGGITHACFGGLGLGYFLGISPVAMAGVFAVGASLGVEWMSTKAKIREDSAISVVWALGMAIGTLFIFLTPGYVPELSSFLFGNILTITRTDLMAFAIYAAVLIAFFALRFRTVIACTFDRDFARTINLPVVAVNYIMTILVALCIVLTIRLIGIMLLMSMFTMPQLIAESYSRQFKGIMLISVAVSIVCSIIGLAAAFFIDVPVSATIVITLAVAFAASRLFNALR